MAGERGGLVADTLLETAVAGDHERVMVDHVVAELCTQASFGNRHADGVRESLTKGTGRDLDADGELRLGVTGRLRSPLAELLDVVELEAGTDEIEHRVLQDRCVAVGEDEPIAVGPVRVGRVVAHHPAEQHVGQRRQRHCGSLVATLGLQRRIHREPANQ